MLNFASLIRDVKKPVGRETDGPFEFALPEIDNVMRGRLRARR